MVSVDVSLFVTSLIVGIFLWCLYTYFTKYYSYWKNKGIIYKEPQILFGNYTNFMLFKCSVGQIYTQIYNEFANERYVGCFKARKPELLIRDLELIKCVLVRDFSAFPNRSPPTVSDDVEKLSANLFQSQGEKWKAMRQKFTPAFSSGKLRNMFHLIVEKGEEFQNFLEDQLNVTDEHECRELMARFTTDVIGSCAFGVKLNSMADSNAPFRKMGKKIFEPSKTKIFKLLMRALAPTIFKLFKIRLNPAELEDFFISTVKQIIEERSEGQSERHDFIDLLLELKAMGHIKNEKDETIIEFTDELMTAQAFIFFAAGFETSSTLMAFTLYELAKNPHVQEKLLSDIDGVLKRHKGKLSYDAISEMRYLECVISEAMRKYPALPVLTRVCNTNYTFPGTNLTLDKGLSVVIPVYGMHYDPQYYPEPEKFIPERFTPEEKQQRHPMVYLPFGDGPRNCIGLRFGKMQSMVGLVSLLTKFRVEPSPKTEQKVVFNTRSFITIPKNGVHLKIKRRTKIL